MFDLVSLTPPPLPLHYQSRDAELSTVRELLLEGCGKSYPAKMPVAIRAMAGMGKTVLATDIARDAAVLKAFPEGVFWMTLGQQPDVLSLQYSLVRALGVANPDFHTTAVGKTQLTHLLEKRRCVLVLDDVWSSKDAGAMGLVGEFGQLLITTQEKKICTALHAQEFSLQVLTPLVARELLAQWARVKLDKLPEEGNELVKQCGYLPLAIAMVGASLRDCPPSMWAAMVQYFKDGELERIEFEFSEYEHPNLLLALRASVRSLKPEEAMYYIDLAVFPEDSWLPRSAITSLYASRGLSAHQSDGLINIFEARSLCRRDKESRVRLHDLHFDYVRKQAGERPNGLTALHESLVRGYMAKCDPKLGLPAGPDDGYYFDHLIDHLLVAGHEATARQLLLSFAWLRSRLTATDMRGLLSDFQVVEQRGAGPTDDATACVAQALRLASHILANDPTQLDSQLVGRLCGFDDEAIKTLVREIREGQACGDGTIFLPITPSLQPPGAGFSRTLEGHRLAVTAVALTPDGSHALSASIDRTLRLWDLQSGRCIKTFVGHRSTVAAVTLRFDGKLAVSASVDKTLKVWDLQKGECISTLQGHGSAVVGVAMTSDGELAVSASADKTLKVWDLSSCECINTLEGHSDLVLAVALTFDGEQAVSASVDTTLKLWDMKSGKCIQTFKGHTSTVAAVAVTSDGSRAISGSVDHSLMVWDLQSGRCIKTLEGHTATVAAVAVTRDGNRAISTSADNTLKVWDLESGACIQTLVGHEGWVTSLALTRDETDAVSASVDRTLKRWELGSGKCIQTIEGHSGTVTTMALTADGQHAVSASQDRTIKIWEEQTGKCIQTLKGHEHWVTAVALTTDGGRVVSASYDKTLKVWDLQSGQCIQTLNSHNNWVSAVALTSDGKQAVSASMDKTLKKWDLQSGKCIQTLEGHTNHVAAVALTTDGNRAVSASADMTLKIWDLDSGKCVRTLEGHRGSVTSVAVTADGNRAVSASMDKTLKIWDLGSGECLRTLEGHNSYVTAVAVSADREYVVSAAFDRTIKLWRLQDGRCMQTFTTETFSNTLAVADCRVIASDYRGVMHILEAVCRTLTDDGHGPEPSETKPIFLPRLVSPNKTTLPAERSTKTVQLTFNNPTFHGLTMLGHNEEIKIMSDKSVHIGGNVTNSQVGQTLALCSNMIQQQALSDRRELLEQLDREVKDLIGKLPEDKKEKASEDYKLLVEQAVKPTPNRKWYSVSAEGLIEASKWAKDFTANIAGTLLNLGKTLVGSDFNLPKQ